MLSKMPEFTKAQELAAECRNKITHATTVLNLLLDTNKKPSEEQIKLAIKDLREASKIIDQISHL